MQMRNVNREKGYCVYNVFLWHGPNIEDSTQWREDLTFIFEWQEQYFTLFLPREQEIDIFELMCNVLFVV